MHLQVSWCKLEVKLSGPKNVTSGCANRQHPPPLVVAALNLKTTLGAQASCLQGPAVCISRPIVTPGQAFPGFGQTELQIPLECFNTSHRGLELQLRPSLFVGCTHCVAGSQRQGQHCLGSNSVVAISTAGF